jgi:prepilin signal peptidase PulO-like enzyme (type II secretory pathway)
MYIPLWAMVGLAILAVAYRFALVLFDVMQVQDLMATYIAAFLITAFFYALYFGSKGRGMGLGDIILAFPIVILVGWPRALVWLFLSFVLGAGVGIAMMIIGKAKMKQKIAFGPFMVAATFLTLIWGEAIWQWYSRFL